MKDKNRLALLAILIILYVSSFASEASDYYFTYVNSENGLSQCHVKSILQDMPWLLWFGTQNGLNLYDGIPCVFLIVMIRNKREGIKLFLLSMKIRIVVYG